MSSWEVHVGPGRKSMFLYLTSSVRAKFSAQLCLLNERECTPVGQVHSVTMVNVQYICVCEKERAKERGGEMAF